MNCTKVKSDDLEAIKASVGPLCKDMVFPCDSPDLRRIFGCAPLGCVLVLELLDRGDHTVVYWQ